MKTINLNDQEKKYYFSRVEHLYDEIVNNAPEQNRDKVKEIVNDMFAEIFGSEDYGKQCIVLLHCDKRGLIQELAASQRNK